MSRHLKIWLALGLALCGLAPGRAEENTRKELAKLAERVKNALAGREETSVHVGGFRPAKDYGCNVGPGLCLALTEELQRLEMTVNPKARFRLEGSYAEKVHSTSRRHYVELAARLVDQTSRETLVDLPTRGIYGIEALVEFLAPSGVALPPDTPEKDREETAVKGLDEPPVLDDTRVFAKDKLYGLEVLVKKGEKFEPRKPVLRDGSAFVTLRRDEVFAIRLHNKAPHVAGVNLTIDGVNTFAFCAFANRRPGAELPRWVVAADTPILIRGWLRNDKQSDEFLITEYARSAAAQLKADAGKVGVITAQFVAAWPRNGRLPEDELAGGSKAPDAVGQGSTIDTPVNPKEYVFGKFRAAVSIRYER